MLASLRIENLAIVEQLEIHLEPGLTVVTGETGAGKSILVRALKLVLGARGKPDLVRTGSQSALVEALFQVGDDPAIQARLAALDLPVDDELLIRRTLQGGRTRGTVNGRLTTATQLRELAKGLVDISSQHEHHTLADPSTHLDTLDAWAQAPDLLAKVSDTYRAAVEARDALRDLQTRASERTEREELLRFQLAELTRLDPQEGEIEALDVEVRRGQHAERIRSVTAGTEHALYSRDSALCAELIQLEAQLASVASHEPRLEPIIEQIAGARADLEDAAEQLGRESRGVDVDPDSLAQREDRLHELKRLARRYGGELSAAIARRQAIEEELSVLDAADDHLESLAQRAKASLASASEAAMALSKARHAAADALGQAISQELGDLGMGGAKVQVEIAALEAQNQDLAYGNARLTSRGVDRAEFLIAPNLGEVPRPLARIASGGELSRAPPRHQAGARGHGPGGHLCLR